MTMEKLGELTGNEPVVARAMTVRRRRRGGAEVAKGARRDLGVATDEFLQDGVPFFIR